MNTYYSKDQYLVWVQNQFLDAVSEGAPQVLRDLQGEPFDRFQESCLTYFEFVCRSEKSNRLRESLEVWSNTWHLQADWCLEAAFWTLDMWHQSGKPVMAFQYLAWSSNYTHIEPPIYRPEFREAYPKAVEEYVAAVDALREPITPQEKRKLPVHLKWTVQCRVLGKSYSQLSDEVGINLENVSRRVREVLTLIDLPKGLL